MPMLVKDLVRLRPETVQLWNGQSWTQVVGFCQTPRTERQGGRGTTDGDLEIEFRSGERVACTRIHQWPTHRGVIQAQELRSGDKIPSVKLPPPDVPLAPALLDDQTVGWVVGFYLAEGNISKEAYTSFSIHTDEEAAFKKISALATSLGDSCTYKRAHGKAAPVIVAGRLFEALMKEYVSGKTCYVKRLTSKAWQRSDRFLRAVAEGYLEGDGHYENLNDRWRLGFCNNDGLAADLRTLAARIGCRVRLRRTVHKLNDQRFPGWKGEWRFNTSVTEETQGEIVAIRAARSRQFWDIEVVDEPNVFALASGLLTHNSPMPESVKNRPAKALEYVFMLVKKMGYFYDDVAIKKISTSEAHAPGWATSMNDRNDRQVDNEANRRSWSDGKNRNFWQADLWFESVDTPHGLTGVGEEVVGIDVTSQGYPGAHFATFPSKLVEPFILAGTSAKGACGKCGAPWRRLTEEKGGVLVPEEERKIRDRSLPQNRNGITGSLDGEFRQTKTLGWQPTCTCFGRFEKRKVSVGPADAKSMPGYAGSNAEGHHEKFNADLLSDEVEKTITEYISDLPLDEHPVVPCTILDPFIGSGTSCCVAIEHGRNSVGIDLSSEYLRDNAVVRIEGALLRRPVTARLIPGKGGKAFGGGRTI